MLEPTPLTPEKSPMPDDLSFDRAQYTPDPIAPTLLAPQAPIPDYLLANSPDRAHFTRAILYGIAGAIAGTILYATFTILTHIEIGYVAIGVGYLVGKAMIAGSGGRGGRSYQIAAAILTYLSVSMAFVPEALWQIHQSGKSLSHINARVALVLAGYGVASPFLDLSEGVGGILGLIILAIGIRAAWRLTSANANTAHHPFSTS
jgi:hypothetical protein